MWAGLCEWLAWTWRRRTGARGGSRALPSLLTPVQEHSDPSLSLPAVPAHAEEEVAFSLPPPQAPAATTAKDHPPRKSRDLVWAQTTGLASVTYGAEKVGVCCWTQAPTS